MNAPATDRMRPHRPGAAVWTPLAAARGYARTRRQRAEILIAAGQMTWSDSDRAGRGPAWGDLHLHCATRAVAAAVVGGHRDRTRQVGTARLPGGRRRIGLGHRCGGRTLLLEDGPEATRVLTLCGAEPPSIVARSAPAGAAR